MSSILNRVLDKAAAPNNNNNNDNKNNNNNDNASKAPSPSSRRETRSSVKSTRNGKQDEQPSSISDNNNNVINDIDNNKTSGNSRAPGNKNTAATTATSKSTAASLTTAATSRSKKSSGTASTAVTSIAERLPKGSRAKPLPPKSTIPTLPSTPTSVYSERQQQSTQTGDKLSQAISLSSSMPSIPSQMEPIDLDEDGDERMTESSAFYLSLATTEGDNDNRHPVTTTTTKHTPQQHQYTTKKVAEDEDQDGSMDRTADVRAAATHDIDPKKKQASIISIASSKDNYASVIPSVQVERIANWMGGVKEAMEDDDTLELSTSRPGHQRMTTSASTNSNNALTALEKPVVKVDTAEDTSATTVATAATVPRKPALRRPPPAPSRHVVTLVDASPPLPPQAQAQSVFEVIPLSLEDEPLQRNYRSGQKTAATSTSTTVTTAMIATTTQTSGSKGKRVFVEDSLSSLPPVPLFHESSNVSESDAHRRRSGGESSSSSTTPFKTSVVNHNTHHYHPHHQDDLSTIVGGQAPTQDSFVDGPVQSLPSFIYETEEEAKARIDGGGGAEEIENAQKDPSLPSELTASCLQELGLKRKNVRDRSYDASGRKRHLKSRVGYGTRGSNIDRVLEEGDDKDDEEEGDEEDEEEDGGVGVALAQRAVFPSSFDLAPISTLSNSVTPPLSLEVIEGPLATYTPAGRTATREDKENEQPSGGTAQQQQQQQQYQGDPPSFPSPPASLVFSTMPSMPTLPTFPSILYQGPSLIMIDSQTQSQTQQTEQTQSQDLNDELND
ncbi:hypothetical protein BG015_006781 [Linnemannia schmuckeri]|uniref:Uncharacterized protein n=1 Tax=Linnemannia schmuckeri TaxID=64567 RepID=A0A9P5S6B1_9FUNG|nr:hypothetical protein BG015_006781 [Linnemannia schmuckeri]